MDELRVQRWLLPHLWRSSLQEVWLRQGGVKKLGGDWPLPHLPSTAQTAPQKLGWTSNLATRVSGQNCLHLLAPVRDLHCSMYLAVPRPRACQILVRGPEGPPWTQFPGVPGRTVALYGFSCGPRRARTIPRATAALPRTKGFSTIFAPTFNHTLLMHLAVFDV